MRQQHRSDEIARADDVHPLDRLLEVRRCREQRERAAGPGRVRDLRGRRLVSHAARRLVFQHDADVSGAARFDEFAVHVHGLRERHLRGRQRGDVERARAHEMQAGVEVALLGPAHVADRIIGAAPLVARVIAARAVTARVANVDLLLVRMIPVEVHLRLADYDDASAIAQRRERLLGGCIARRGGREDDGVHAVAFGPRAHVLREIVLAQDDDGFSAHRLCIGGPRRRQIDGHHSHARGTQDAGDEQTDEPLTHDEHALAHSRIELAHGLQRDRGDRRIGSPPVLEPFGHARGEQVGHRDELRVKGAFGSTDCHAIADAETGIQGVDHLDHARGAVAEGRRHLEAVAHLFERGAPAERSRRVEHLAHLVRTCAGFLKQVHARLLHLHLLGSRADHGVRDTHENAAGWRGRLWHFLQLEPSVLVLRYLHHEYAIPKPE
jgi:hypothetical protein